MQPSRRHVLAGAVVTLAAACTKHRAPRPVAVDPDVALTSAAIAREQALIDAYDAALLRFPELWPELSPYRDDHVAHLHALQPTPSPTPALVPTGPSPSPHPAAVLGREKAALAALERTAAAAHAHGTATASADLAQLLASLAASESSHAAALR